MFDVLADLLLPSGCVGCPGPHGPLCARCRSPLSHPQLHRPDPDPPGLPPLAVAAAYQGPVRAAVLAYKERSRRDLARALGIGLAGAVREVAREVAPGRPGGATVFRLVPVPSAEEVARRRGGQHVGRLATVAARVLRRGGISASVAPVLRTGREHADTATLTAVERSRAATGKFRADLSRLPVVSTSCVQWVVVDDVVTTGSTLVAACRALCDDGLAVLGAAAVAATQRWHAVSGGEHGESLKSCPKADERQLLPASRSNLRSLHSDSRVAVGVGPGVSESGPAQLPSRRTRGEEAYRRHRPWIRWCVVRREGQNDGSAL